MSSWRANGQEFTTEWAGVEWTLRPGARVPGLYCAAPALGPVLGLEGLAQRGRTSPLALSASTLVAVEQRFGRVTATYRPLGWGAIQVRATWWPSSENSIDLNVEIQARTVGLLHAVEVKILSAFEPIGAAGLHRSVTPRDAAAAGLSYDGRETDLSGLTTGPPGEPLTPWLAPRSGISGKTYVEFAQPHDVSRRIHEGKLPFATTRYGLFGHDLEKGIVLRARLRGLWLPKTSALDQAESNWARFLQEPPPLTT